MDGASGTALEISLLAFGVTFSLLPIHQKQHYKNNAQWKNLFDYFKFLNQTKISCGNRPLVVKSFFYAHHLKFSQNIAKWMGL